MADSRAPAASPSAPPLTEADMAELERLLDRVPAPLEPLDLMMLDGYLCGVLLQPAPVPEAQWFPHVIDIDARPAPGGFPQAPLQALVRRRHAELNRAIHGRQWFDPWVFELDDEEDPLATVMPWVAGFATAMEFFPQLMRNEAKEVLEPLAVLYRCFDPEDLEDADDLLEMIEMIEPPADLADAVEGLVTSTLLLADVTRPQSGRPNAQRHASRPQAPRGGSGGGGGGQARRPAAQRAPATKAPAKKNSGPKR